MALVNELHAKFYWEQKMKLLVITLAVLLLNSITFGDYSVSYESVAPDRVKMKITYSDHLLGNLNGTKGYYEVTYFDAFANWSSAEVIQVGVDSLTGETVSGANITGWKVSPLFRIKPGNNPSDWYFFYGLMPFDNFSGPIYGPATMNLNMDPSWGPITIGSAGGHGFGFTNYTPQDMIINGDVYYIFVADINEIPDGACCVSSGCASVQQVLCHDFGGVWLGEATSCDDCATIPEPCAADLNGDEVVNVDDLLLLIASWGACP